MSSLPSHPLGFRYYRNIIMAAVSRCAEGQTEDCPQEAVWVIFSAVLDATGSTSQGFLQAVADGALSPVDVESAWYT